MSLFERSAEELQELLHSKEITIADLTQEAYNRIDEVDGEVRAFLSIK